MTPDQCEHLLALVERQIDRELTLFQRDAVVMLTQAALGTAAVVVQGEV